MGLTYSIEKIIDIIINYRPVMTEADDQAHNMILGLLMSELYWCIVLTHRYILKSTQFPCYFFLGETLLGA